VLAADSRYAGKRQWHAAARAVLKAPDAAIRQGAEEASPYVASDAATLALVSMSGAPGDRAGITASALDTAHASSNTATAASPARVVAVTACPTGVAHTFMAAEALQQAAKQHGITLELETRGSVGARNPLTPEAIAAADVVMLAVDIEVDNARFAGKRIYRCKTGAALKDPAGALTRALAEGKVESVVGGASANGAGPNASAAGSGTSDAAGLYKHLLTGVSYMLPMVVAGGLLIALSFVFGIEAFKEPGTLAAALKQVGDAAFMLMIPVLAGYIAYSIADRPGLAPGMIGGALASTLGAGFIGGIVAGFLGGYTARWINRGLKLPASVEALKPILLIPLFASLVTGMAMIYLVGGPVATALASMTQFLNSMGTTNAIALGVLLGAMMCVDLGGPINKAAYAFTVGLLASNVHGPMAVTMAAGMVPPIGMGLATLFARSKFSAREREAGKAAGVLGMCFISEGAIPFAAKDPLRVIPASIIGGAATGALVAWLGCRLVAPHGGFFVLLIPGAMNRPWAYIGAILAGSLLTAVVYALIKSRAAPEMGEA
ncbi:MAG: PTS transporter subunit EIIC, partial [Burkholderiaceae bacterium]|nr:PTS transporter subunit EIIC [Burkholderiaceae bacterium]